MISHIFSETPLSSDLLAVVHCRFTVGDLYDRYHDISYASVVMWTPLPASPAARRVALTSVTHRDDAVDAARAHNLNNRPLLSLSLAKLASGTSTEKPSATYTRVNDFGPHTDSIFRGRLICESDLYASIYDKRICVALSQQMKHNKKNSPLHMELNTSSHLPIPNILFLQTSS